MKKAELEIMRVVQKAEWPEEIASMKVGKNLKASSPLLKLSPFLADDVLRVGGRLRRAPIDEDAKHQVLVPKSTCVAKLIVNHYHNTSGHSGREYVLALVRQR